MSLDSICVLPCCVFDINKDFNNIIADGVYVSAITAPPASETALQVGHQILRVKGTLTV